MNTNYIMAVDFGTMRTKGPHTSKELRAVKAERRRLNDREFREHHDRAQAPAGWRWVEETPEPGITFICGAVRP